MRDRTDAIAVHVRDGVILAATDLSPASTRALEWAVELAERRHADLHIVHAVAPAPRFGVSHDAAYALTDGLVAEGWRLLQEALAPLRRRLPSLTSEVCVGTPSDVILRTVKTWSPQLLVVGTRGLRGWRHLLLGSTAERVLGRACCPVLAVHEGDPPPPSRPLRLLAATDFSRDAEEALGAAVRLFGDSIAEVVLLHVFEPPPLTPPGELLASGDLIGALRASAEEALASAASMASRIAHPHPVRSLLRDGYPPSEIAATAHSLAADMVVMGTRGQEGIRHLLLGSNAERLAQIGACPLLVLPRGTWQVEGAATGFESELVAAPLDDQC
jgi:nucleotide-binding universal stress UspA family protein